MKFDIVVSSDSERYLGLHGRVLKSCHRGVFAWLENGEEVDLKNSQFDYIMENSLSYSQDEKGGVN